VDESLGAREPAGETPAQRETLDPATWQWTAGDRVFLDLLQKAHALGMHIIIDGVFNHVGEGFWAWQEVRARGRDSPYAEWFEVTEWTETYGFAPEGSSSSLRPRKWNGWSGPGTSMVRVARRGDGLHPDFERHIFDITRRWMDPNGDGDPSDGVDGWRLDVADAIPHGFWRRWRTLVKSINPQALIIGEIWGEASPWLHGDEFDAVMNYSFAMPTVRFFRSAARFPATDYVAAFEQVLDRHSWSTNLAMQNLLDSHDTDRIASMLANTERPYDRQNRPDQPDSDYDAGEPNEAAYQRLRLASFLQFTWVGAPLVYYGTEVGMYGADDPFDRGPMWWALDRPDSQGRAARAERHADLRAWYRTLTAMRARHPALRRGRVRSVLADDARRVLAYIRWTADERLLVILNAGGDATRVRLDVGSNAQSAAVVFPTESDGPDVNGGYVELDLKRSSGTVLKLTDR
ncbi:MAG TPA: alpha-amylase family glycosyl hydrolase, partial [Phycisphaerae bacterium]